MKLKNINSIQIAPNFCKDDATTAILEVFDDYIQEYAERAESLPIYSHSALYSMNDSELSEIADSLGNLAYNKGFDKDFRVNALWNTLSDFNLYGTVEGIKKIVENSTPVEDLQVVVVEHSDGDEDWALEVTASEPIPVLTADIYNHNALMASRISQGFQGISYTVDAEVDDVRSVCAGTMGWSAYVEITYIVGDYGDMDDDGDTNTKESPKGEMDGTPFAVYKIQLEEGDEGLYGEIDLAVEATAYLRSAAYQHLNKSVTANSTNFLYDPGAEVSLYVDGSKTYTLKGAYTNGDVSVDTTGASLTLIESSGQYSLRLVWGSTAAQVCYIKYEIV